MYKKIILIFFLLFIGVSLLHINHPLQGILKIRQADTLISGWSMCVEKTPFLLPKIAHRGDSSGVSIGEFPLASWLYSLPCKITGIWSDSLAKLLHLFFYLLFIFLWGRYLKLKYPDYWQGYPSVILFFALSTHFLLNYTVPIPDLVALIIFSISLQSQSHVSILLFATSFLMRPYLIFLIPMFTTEKKKIVYTLFLCSILYLFWYKFWIQNSATSYYATQSYSAIEDVSTLKKIAYSIFEFIFRNHLQFVMVPVFFHKISADKNIKYLWLYFLIALFGVVILRGEMIINHKYYLTAASIYLSTIMYLTFNSWTLKTSQTRSTMLVLVYLVISTLQVQHHLLENTLDRKNAFLDEIKKSNYVAGNLVEVYAGLHPDVNTHIMYWTKTVGFSHNLKDVPAHSNCLHKSSNIQIIEYSHSKIIVNNCM